ncbi:MAG: HAD-IIB family hydrolase [Deltaproteobacteria bacterium]|nr:HAD-IIB family hydrolase [Deltaproteobacteria bacterium]
MKLIITDLDGTLLDHNTYSFEAARTALDRVKQLSVPLILCSSKTRDEIVLYCNKLGMKLPFISENGGGIYLPKGFLSVEFEERIQYSSKDKEYLLIEMGTGRDELRKVFLHVREATGIDVRSFSDMTVDEVMGLTSLPENEAVLAMERSFTEPFIFSSGDDTLIGELVARFNGRGLTVVKGGRFYHLMGNTADKGTAVKKIKGIFSKIARGKVMTMGLGDSENDLSMLSAVERPVIVRKWDGSWMEAEGTENFVKTEGIGPVGWNDAVLKFLDGNYLSA